MSWADANANDDGPPDGLSPRTISDLEHTINIELEGLRHEIGFLAAAIQSFVEPGFVNSASPLGDLEAQLARAVTVSLSAALEHIRESLTEAVADAVAQLASRLEAVLGGSPEAPVVRAQLSTNAVDLDEVAASLQHAVLLALTSFEQSSVAPSPAVSNEALATARDVARVNQRIDELRSLLLG